MNIFIDTSIIYSDPFWKRNFSSQLLDVSSQDRVKIFLSEVVLKELRHNFEKSLDKEIFDLRGSNSNLRKLLRRFKPFDLPDKEQCISDFDKFYEDIQTYKNVEILPCKEEFLHRVLDMSINRKKPFTEKKTELKDALIWLTYSNYVKQNNLQECFFLTENSTDFCNIEKLKNKEYELHPDLLKECDRFNIFLSIKDFYTANSSFLDGPKNDLQEWIESENIDDDYVFDLIIYHKEEKIRTEVSDCLGRIDPTTIFDDGEFVVMGGYLDIGEIEWYKCTDTGYQILDDCALISGILLVSVGIEAHGYNSDIYSDQEQYPFIGNTTIDVNVTFTFTLKKDRKPENFEIIGTEIKR